MSSHRKRIVLIVAAAVGAVLLWSVLARGRAPHADPAASAAPSVSVVTAQRTPLKITLALSGEFKPFQEVDLHAKVAGYIKTISVDVGDRVRTGQVLAVLEIPELQAQLQEADASLDRSRSAHDMAHSAYERLKQVSEARPGLIAAQELEDAYARDKQAEAQVAQASAGLRQATALSDYSRITAPFTGVITRRYADTGALIQAGTSSNTQAMPVVRLAEDDKLRLVLPVPESAVAQIRVGTTVGVRVPALDRTLEGRVARISDDLDRQTRTMETEIDVANPGESLVAGMYAETRIDLAKKDAALTVPIQAVSRNGSDASVLVVNPQNRVERRPVQIGMEGSRRLEIVGGLSEGDRVVLGGHGQIRAGDEVRPQPAAEDAAAAEGDR
jgi:RND family efflux transporter MFP subunit